MIIDISKFEKEEVLAALVNGASAKNVPEIGCFLKFFKQEPFTVQEAKKLILSIRKFEGKRNLYFDYVHGRPLKVDLNTDELDTFLYDRDNGKDAAWEVVQELADKKGVNLKILKGG